MAAVGRCSLGLAVVVAIAACGGKNGATGGGTGGALGTGTGGNAGGPPADAGQHDHPPSDGTCPAAPPFDDTDPALAHCTRPVAVAVGNALRRAVSYDGQAWVNDQQFPDTTLTDQNENSHRDAIVALGLIVVAGDGGILVSSDGGATFTVADNGRHHDAGVTLFQGAIWVLSSAGTFSTTDGASWMQWTGTSPTLPGGLKGAFNASAATASDGRLVAVSGRDTKSRVFDGATWTEQTLDTSMFGQLVKVVFGGGTFLMIGQGCCNTQMYAGLRATSSDGLAWSVVTNASPGASSFRFGDAIWDGARFLATGSKYDSRTYVSADGVNWTQRNTNNVSIGPVAAFGSGYVGASGVGLYQSDDGVTWNKTFTGGGDASWSFVRVASGRVLAP